MEHMILYILNFLCDYLFLLCTVFLFVFLPVFLEFRESGAVLLVCLLTPTVFKYVSLDMKFS